MPSKPIAPQIDFAKRHIVESISTFNAASALYRIEVLLDDLLEVKKRLEATSLDGGFHPWAYEFSGYYTVGYITCLEWHARSRLYDLYVFDPKVIEASDIKQSISDAKLMQMLSENLTVAQLIAGSTNVSSLERYVGIFNKIFERLGSKTKVSEIMNDSKLQSETGESCGQRLSELYEYRNKLVHEIDLMRIGHYNIRDMLHFDDAIQLGQLCQNCMRAIEDAIRVSAPPEFPNLLSENYYTIDINSRLIDNISELQTEIQNSITEGRFPLGISAAKWKKQTEKFDKYLESHWSMLESLDIPGAKYHDPRPSMLTSLLKQRIEILMTMKKELVYDEPLFE